MARKMMRLALCAVGLAFAAPSALAKPGVGASLDHIALLQTGRGSTEAPTNADQESVEVLGSSQDDAGYAFEKYDEGQLVEGKSANGKWVLCVVRASRPGHLWDIHVVEKLPGYDLPGVPAQLLRRRLGENETDWHVDNSRLQHKGFGIAYRRSKNLKDVTLAWNYAPFDSLVVGKDEGDGWLKVTGGYIPMRLYGERVLTQKPREEPPVKLSKEFRDWYVKEEAARHKAAAAKEALQPPPLQHYANSEEVSFKTKDGGWRRAQVASHGLFPDTYNVLVGPSRSIALSVPSSQLQKAGPPKHTPIEGESPICQRQGCLDLRLRAATGTEYKVRAVMGLRIHVLMRAACARMHQPWKNCQTRLELSHGGRLLSPSWRTYEAGLASGDVVDLNMTPETATPVREVSA